MPKTYEDWNLTIGEVVAIFGLRGELKVRINTDFQDPFAQAKKVCLRPRSKADPAATGRVAQLFDIERARMHKEQVLLKVRGIESIEDAERWRGARVQIRRSDVGPLPENSYYSQDLIGFDVVTRTGRVVGKLEKILPYPAQDLFQIGDILIPAVKEMVEVDPAARRIIVDPPEGLLPDETEE
jgi:16S rRNA processing protein RimM